MGAVTGIMADAVIETVTKAVTLTVTDVVAGTGQGLRRKRD